MGTVRQLLSLPTSIRIMSRLLDDAFTPRVMDRALFDVYGALHLNLPESELRLWPKVEGGFEAVHPKQIERTPLSIWKQMILFAAETEAPINNYSTASAEVLQAFLPSLSSYMGRTISEEKEFLKTKTAAQEFCDRVWCREESRHGPTLVAVAQRISGTPLNSAMTYQAEPPGDFSDEKAVYTHIIARNCSEWHANGLYLYLQSHATGATAKWLENVRTDETRHLTVFATAYTYLYGPQFKKRIQDMLKFSVKLRKAHKKNNSHGTSIVRALNTSVILELALLHFLIEQKIRGYVGSVPLMTMKKIFERESTPTSGDLLKRREELSRLNLQRWPKALRDQEVRKSLERKKYADRIVDVLKNDFHFFESVTNVKDFQSKLTSLRLEKNLNHFITELYRDYEIMSCGLKGSSRELKLEFMDPESGFVIRAIKDDQGKEYACFCKGVTTQEVVKKIQLGFTNLEAIKTETLACTGCGRCESTITGLLNLQTVHS